MPTLRDIHSAFALLTVIPMGSGTRRSPGVSTVSWFPVVGLVLGASVLIALAALNMASTLWGDGEWLHRAALPLAVCIVAFLALLTRLIHWDGLADVADAWWGGQTVERRLEIMSDSSIGSFGAATVLLGGMGQVVALAAVLAWSGLGVAVLAVPVFGRLSIVFAAWLGTPAKPGGLGALVMGRPAPMAAAVPVVATMLAIVPVILEHGLLGAAWCGFAILVAAVVPHIIALRMGGVTGDVMGASVVMTETVILVAAALAVTF